MPSTLSSDLSTPAQAEGELGRHIDGFLIIEACSQQSPDHHISGQPGIHARPSHHIHQGNHLPVHLHLLLFHRPVALRSALSLPIELSTYPAAPSNGEREDLTFNKITDT